MQCSFQYPSDTRHDDETFTFSGSACRSLNHVTTPSRRSIDVRANLSTLKADKPSNVVDDALDWISIPNHCSYILHRCICLLGGASRPYKIMTRRTPSIDRQKRTSTTLNFDIHNRVRNPPIITDVGPTSRNSNVLLRVHTINAASFSLEPRCHR